MEDIFRKTTTASAIDRLRTGPSGGPLADLPGRSVTRPGWIDRLTATRAERGLMRQEDEAVATVRSEQVRAATEVALAMTENAKTARLKADLVENDQFHHEMEAQMMSNCDDAKEAQQALVTRIAREPWSARSRSSTTFAPLRRRGRSTPTAPRCSPKLSATERTSACAPHWTCARWSSSARASGWTAPCRASAERGCRMARLLVLVALGLALWLAFAPEGLGPQSAAVPVSLAELAAAPSRHDGQRVTVRGQVVERATVLGVGGVLIADASGHQLLAAGWTGPVVPGETVTVTGTYRVALAVGDLQVPVILTGCDSG